MKKIIKLTAALMAFFVFAMLVTGCGVDEEKVPSSEEPVEVGNNVIGPQPADSIDTLNKKIGCNMIKPEGYTLVNEAYYIIDSSSVIAEYLFDIEGCSYTFRASATQDDITGVYLADGLLGDTVDTGSKVLPAAVSTGGFWARWFDGKMQYVLYSGNAPENTFTAVYGLVNQ